MDRVVTFLNHYLQDPEALRWGVTGTVALGVFLLIVGVSYVFIMTFSPARMRLRRIVGRPADNGPSMAARIGEKLEPLTPYLLPKKEWERTKIDAQLVHAGFRSPKALTLFYTIKSVVGILLAVVVIGSAPLIGQLSDKQFSMTQIVMAVLFSSLVGMALPNLVLNRIVQRRQRRIRKGFPDALDMLVVAMEAGIGLAAAIQRVSRELRHSHPALADELGLVNAEIRSGIDRGEALRNLARRTGVEDIKIFAGMIAQTLRYGTSIADTLRVFSDDFRDKRLQQAEEQAAKIGTKMIFPMALCFFPAFFVVALGPGALKIIEVFGRM